MAANLGEALSSLLISRATDPLHGSQGRIADTMIEDMELDALSKRARQVDEIDQMLTEAVNRNANASTVAAYNKMLARLAGR